MSVYLDNAASTPMDPRVFEEMKPFFLNQFGNPSSTHAYGRELRNALENARRRIAKCLNVRPLTLFFTSGGTESDNLAILGAVNGLGVKHIISSPIEHHAVTHPIEKLEKEGRVTVSWLKVGANGQIDLDDLRQELEAHPNSLVSLMHANNEIGTIYDIEAIGNICREYNAYYHSDTVQSLGKVALDLDTLPVDFITASAHKFYGPKGVGFLYVRKGIALAPQFTGGGQERDLRPGTENIPAIIGMAKAFELAHEEMEARNEHMNNLKIRFWEMLQTEFPGVKINGETDPSKCIPGLINITLPGEGDPMILFNLDLAGVAASGGSACSSGAVMGSHVLHHIGVQSDEMPRSVRFSFGKFSSEEDLEVVKNSLKSLNLLQVS
ncbi:MAG: cysteine desulfurase [Bacteroidia bacterium]|nr:cysteine desulfurase [Bacteroidia bacterium]